MSKVNEEQQEEVKETPFFNFLDRTDFISNIVEIAIIFLASFIAVLKSRESIRTYIGILFKKRYDKEIDDILNKIQALSCADRVLLGLFHNGIIHYKFEVCNRGIGKVKDKLRTSITEEEVNLLRESDNHYIFTYLEDNQVIANDSIIEIDKHYKDILIKIGVKVSCRLLMKQGIISIQYIKENNLCIFQKNRKEILMLRDYLEIILG